MPLDDLALQSNKILLIDHHTDIFIWSGREVASPQYNDIRDAFNNYAIEESKHRFPQPRIAQFKVKKTNFLRIFLVLFLYVFFEFFGIFSIFLNFFYFVNFFITIYLLLILYWKFLEFSLFFFRKELLWHDILLVG